MAPNRVQLSLSEKNTIAALHKAGLKGSAIARETGHPLSTIYGVLKRFKQPGDPLMSSIRSMLYFI
jgi:IS30 family transposase